MQPERFHELKATGNLPSPTGVALALLELTNRDDATVADVARLLASDPALAGRVLKFANSPLSGRSRPVVSLPEALLLVGLHVVRQLVLGLSVVSAHRSGRCDGFDYDRYWSAALATAVAAQALARRDRAFPPDEVFTCGLLAGVGRLALATVHPSDYANALATAGNGPVTALLAAERQRFYIDHVELGVAMLAEWGVPALHRSGVAAQYDPGHAGTDPRASALAGCLAEARRFAAVLTAAEDRREHALAQLLEESPPGLDLDALRTLLTEITAQWREWSRNLELPLPATASPGDGESDDPAHGTARNGVRVLVVDDDEAPVVLLRALLGAAGYVVRGASGGREALKLAMEWQPHIVVSDWLMPDLDGLDLCRALRNTREGQGMYIVIVTAHGGEEVHVAAFDAGADDYMQKPIVPRVLAARLRAATRVIRLQDEVAHEHEEIRRYLAEIAVANRRLEQAALTDPLTQLPNRRHAMQRLRQVWAASRRAGDSYACMLIDVDHFKQINDTWGHAMGDQVLCEVAALLRSTARTDDEVCRIGGEEFLVICANSDAQSARATAERLREAVAKRGFLIGAETLRLNVSIGVASHPAELSEPDCIMAAADDAVYRAKRAGRNRVCESLAPAGEAPVVQLLKVE